MLLIIYKTFYLKSYIVENSLDLKKRKLIQMIQQPTKRLDKTLGCGS